MENSQDVIDTQEATTETATKETSSQAETNEATNGQENSQELKTTTEKEDKNAKKGQAPKQDKTSQETVAKPESFDFNKLDNEAQEKMLDDCGADRLIGKLQKMTVKMSPEQLTKYNQMAEDSFTAKYHGGDQSKHNQFMQEMDQFYNAKPSFYDDLLAESKISFKAKDENGNLTQDAKVFLYKHAVFHKELVKQFNKQDSIPTTPVSNSGSVQLPQGFNDWDSAKREAWYNSLPTGTKIIA